MTEEIEEGGEETGRERRETRGRLRRGPKEKEKSGGPVGEEEARLATCWQQDKCLQGRHPLRGTTAAQKPAYEVVR